VLRSDPEFPMAVNPVEKVISAMTMIQSSPVDIVNLNRERRLRYFCRFERRTLE
jgi:hypothetical protein